jgi:hypothetical protein
VDPEEVRWIPSNHPFATTKNYIEEGLAQQNMYQTRGVPSRVKAEHEALRKKMMEATSKVHTFLNILFVNYLPSPTLDVLAAFQFIEELICPVVS